MCTTAVIGPVTGRRYAAYATDEVWNGSPVLAFTAAQIHALVAAGDGADSNGYGLTVQDGRVIDVTGPDESDDVPTITAEVDGARCVLYVPGGRQWDEADTNSTITPSTYDVDDQCRACGEQISDPHSPQCPTAGDPAWCEAEHAKG